MEKKLKLNSLLEDFMQTKCHRFIRKGNFLKYNVGDKAVFVVIVKEKDIPGFIMFPSEEDFLDGLECFFGQYEGFPDVSSRMTRYVFYYKNPIYYDSIIEKGLTEKYDPRYVIISSEKGFLVKIAEEKEYDFLIDSLKNLLIVIEHCLKQKLYETDLLPNWTYLDLYIDEGKVTDKQLDLPNLSNLPKPYKIEKETNLEIIEFLKGIERNKNVLIGVFNMPIENISYKLINMLIIYDSENDVVICMEALPNEEIHNVVNIILEVMLNMDYIFKEISVSSIDLHLSLEESCKLLDINLKMTKIEDFESIFYEVLDFINEVDFTVDDEII